MYLPRQVAVDPATVASLVAITGSPEEAVVQALAAAYGNADVAAEYLMNGNKIQRRDGARIFLLLQRHLLACLAA